MKEEVIEQVKIRFINNNNKILDNNKDLIALYNQYVEKVVELFDFIKNKDSDFFYTILFDILIEIGFFSADHEFNTDKNVFNELSIKPGISVINGEGVCRNIACFYQDVFSYFYNYPLLLCCYDVNGESNEDTKIYGNHIINLTDYQDTIYGFDIMNHCVFKAINEEILKGVDNDYLLTYMPGGDLILKLTTSLKLDDNLYKEIEIKKDILSRTAKRQVIDEDEFKKLILDANDFIIKRKKLFQSFMIQNTDLTKEIKKKMLLLK